MIKAIDTRYDLNVLATFYFLSLWDDWRIINSGLPCWHLEFKVAYSGPLSYQNVCIRQNWKPNWFQIKSTFPTKSTNVVTKDKSVQQRNLIEIRAKSFVTCLSIQKIHIGQKHATLYNYMLFQVRLLFHNQNKSDASQIDFYFLKEKKATNFSMNGLVNVLYYRVFIRSLSDLKL